MSIPLFDYIKSLLPRLRKDDILEDLRITKGELESSKGMYALASAELTAIKWSYGELVDLTKVFYRNYKSSVGKGKNVTDDIAKALPNVLVNLGFINDQIEKIIGEDVLNADLSAKKAILIRSCEYLAFISKYSYDFLLYAVSSEAVAKKTATDVPMSEAKLQFVKNNILQFSTLLTVYSKTPDKFKEDFNNIPDVIVSGDNVSTVASVFSNGALDPYGSVLQKGFIGSPIYHIRLIFAEWQADRYKVCKDKRQMLELRVMQLKLLQEDLNDPSLERQIEYLQGRIDKLDRKLADMET